MIPCTPLPQERDYRLLISRRGVLAPGQLAATRLTLLHNGRALLEPSRHKQIIGKPAVDLAVSGAALLWRARVWLLLAVIVIIISKLRGRRRFLISVIIVALAVGTVAVPRVVAGIGGNISYELVGQLLGLVGEAEQEYCQVQGDLLAARLFDDTLTFVSAWSSWPASMGAMATAA